MWGFQGGVVDPGGPNQGLQPHQVLPGGLPVPVGEDPLQDLGVPLPEGRGTQGRREVQQGGKGVVVHPDQGGGETGRLLRLRQDGPHRVPHVQGVVGEDPLVPGVGLIGEGQGAVESPARIVLGGEDPKDPRHLPRLGDVHVPNPTMGHRAEEEPTVGGLPRRAVPQVAEPPLQLLQEVEARHVSPHVPEGPIPGAHRRASRSLVQRSSPRPRTAMRL